LKNEGVMTDRKNKLSRPKKTIEELRKASDALHYEIWMFDEMVKSLSTQSPQIGNPQYNALVESFVQHMRNLLEFFYPTDKVRPDTIIASDFFLTQNQSEKKIQPWLDNERKDSHQFLAHLTYDRMKKDKRWDYLKISKYINEIVEEFLKEVPQDLIREKLKNYKVPPVNIIKSPIDDMFASTTEALLPGISVTRDIFK
jgi:hypothetical protein